MNAVQLNEVISTLVQMERVTEIADSRKIIYVYKGDENEN